MSYTYQNLKSDLSGLSHGTDVNNITNLDSLVWRAARKVLAKISPRETRRIQNLSKLHDEVYNFSIPSDAKKIIDIRPQANRNRGDNIRQRYGRLFDTQKSIQDDIYAIQHDSGRKFIRISKDVSPSPKTLHEMNSLTANGTWTAGTGASNLDTDTEYYISGSKSIKFDIGATGGEISVDGFTDVNLSDHEDISELFLDVYLPDSSIITNIELRWGSSTAYWSVTEDDQADGTEFRNGWNLLKFSWNGASQTGSPDSSAVDYALIKITSTSDDTDIRVDNLKSSKGEIYEIVYYSNKLFRNSSGTWIAKPTNAEDIVNLDEDSYNILVLECMIEVARQTAGEDSQFDIQQAEKELGGSQTQLGLYDEYKASYPSEVDRPVGFYYNIR